MLRLITQIWEGIKMKEPSVLNLLHQWILTSGCRVFATHSRQRSTLFSHLLDSVFLLGCNSITSFVLWQLAPSFECFPEMYGQGVLGQQKFTCSNSNQIPGECTSCCVRPSFKEISCVVMRHLKHRAFFLFSGQLCTCRLRWRFKFCCKRLKCTSLCIFISLCKC